MVTWVEYVYGGAREAGSGRGMLGCATATTDAAASPMVKLWS